METERTNVNTTGATPPPTPETQLAALGKSDVNALIAQAKVDAQAQVALAVGAANNLLAMAAGDLTASLTPAEQAYLPNVVDRVPAIVRNRVQIYIDKQLQGVNAQADAAVQVGLAQAALELQHLQDGIDAKLQ
jgi:hypothetical protein